MTFPINTTIPAAGNDPSIDQQPMQTNFANINSYLGVDHTTPGTNPGDGQHKQVTFHSNQAAPSIANGVSGIFANSATGSQLFFQNAAALYQLTNLPVVTGVNTGTAGGTLNYFDTPWNMRVYFGTTAGGSGGTVLFTPIANYTTLYFANATCNDGNAHYVSCGQFPSQLTLKSDIAVSSIVWFSFGRL